MNVVESGFESQTGTSIYFRLWQPVCEPRALMIIAHGLAEHSGRYRHVAEHFADLGIVVAALDHAGHGQSAGQRCYIGAFDEYVDTLERFRDHLRGLFPALPLVLMGHSMGGLIAARYAHRYQRHLNALVLSGPAFTPAEKPPKPLEWLMRGLSMMFPRLGVVQLVPESICRDPKVVDDYQRDPLVWKGKLSARLAVELFDNMGLALAGASDIDIPLMIVQGEDDRLTAARGAERFFNEASSEVKRLEIYPGLFHEVLNEPEKEQVLNDISAWLEPQLSASSAE